VQQTKLMHTKYKSGKGKRN